jgi:hypothetical protein
VRAVASKKKKKKKKKGRRGERSRAATREYPLERIAEERE